MIVDAWSDEPWVNDGASVRVSIVSFERQHPTAAKFLNGLRVTSIGPDLEVDNSPQNDLKSPARFVENLAVAFAGYQTNGPFDIPGDVAREWLLGPVNPNGKRNSAVLRPIINASDVVRRNADLWVVVFDEMEVRDAALYQSPFEHVERNVKPQREQKREKYLSENWWLHKRRSPAMRQAIAGLPRFIATPQVSKWRLFVWLHPTQIPENTCLVFARDDDTTFGILHSKFHELWSLRMCTWLGVGNDPRYTPTTCFETFPFPEGLTPNIPGLAVRRRSARHCHCQGRRSAERTARKLAEPA